jgi:hypothetical protein
MFNVFESHPQVYVPRCKDLYFFDKNYGRGLNWYKSHFKGVADHKAVGELSHDYLFSSDAARRIRKDLPGVKLLTCLRDPAERSFSQYLYLHRSGLTKDTFKVACSKFPRIIENSLYYKHLKVYLDLFDHDQIKILFFDDLKENSVVFANQILSFLDVETGLDLPYNEHVRPASAPRSFLLAKIAKKGANNARRFRMEGMVGKLKDSCLTHLLYSPYKPSEKPRLSKELRDWLKKKFEDDIRQLERELGISLERWLE